MQLSGIGAALLVLQAAGFSANIFVPDHYPTIQAGIAAATDGDTVIVRPGTYVENIDFLGKAITVKGECGPELTVIDGNQAWSTVVFISGEGLSSVLEGFTVTNGSGYDKHYNGWSWGGGIFCDNSSPLIPDLLT